MSFEEASFKEAGLKFHFIVKTGISDISEHMGAAYEHLKEYVESEDNIKFVIANDCLQINRDVLTKRDIFILNEFSGEVFDYLQASNCLIVGPKCLVTCLLETQSIPLGKSPVFITPMRNLFITASGFSIEKKSKIKNMVAWMGGYYFDDLNMQCSHLISNTVRSDKYEKAGLNGIPIMHINWLDDVWERNLTETISATSAEFDKHKLPIFHGLNITSSGLKEDKKQEMIRLITENGGEYVRAFKSKVIDILIIEKEHADSEKFNAAMKFKKECLLPDWIVDSVTKGFALPTKHYKVNKIKVSTPTKLSGTSVSNFNPDCTEISAISHMDLPLSNKTINETLPGGTCTAQKSSQRTFKDILKELKLEDVKRAGNFLDGCCVTSAGFTAMEKEKLNKILNIGGAVRYDELNEKVTHIIVGQLNAAEYKKLKDCNIPASFLIFDWVVKSITLKQPADETEFIYQPPTQHKQEPEAPSPSSKRTIQSMNHSFRKPAVPRKRLQFGSNLSATSETEEKNLLAGYKNPEPEFNYIPARPTSQDSSIGSTRCTAEYYFLDGLTVYVHEQCENVEYIREDCQACGGFLVNDDYRDVVDYVLVSSSQPIDVTSLPIKYKNIVNDLWIEDAMQENKLLEKKYFYDYIPTTVNSKPLKDMHLVISLYSGNERLFIASLGSIMGATVQEVYARKDCSLLICHSPEGAKYTAAVKWGLPVVTCDWLVECAKSGTKMELEPYLVGETKADAFNKPRPSTSNQAIKELQEAALQSDDSDNNQKLENLDNEQFAIRHPRVSELTNPGRRLSTNSLDSPSISPSQVVLNVSDFVKGVSTPNRELLYNVLKELEGKETPVSERLRKLAVTPGTKHGTPPTPKIPEFYSTPEVHKRRYEFLNRYHIPIDRKTHTPSPTISDIKRRMWKEALGEHYFEDGNYNTQAVSQLDKSTVGAAHDAQDEENHIPSTNFKRLSDFIKNRKEKKDYEKCSEEDTENIQGKLEEHVGPTQEMVGWTDPSEFVPLKRSKLGGMQHKGTPRFSISCSDDALMDSLIKSIKLLRGEVCENLVSFDETCTHIICEKPNRGEKILSGIASGKWILELKYIEDSKSAGYFLDEEQYEFGNPSAVNFTKLEANEQALAKASFRWRTKIADSCEKIAGAFDGFRVILHVQKKDQFQRVINAGGGVVLNVISPFAKCKEALKATHCFVDQKNLQLKPADHKALRKADVRVLSVLYLNAYLTSETEPDYTKYLLSL